MMKDVFFFSNKFFSVMVIVDILVVELWMIFLLFGVGNVEKIDKFFCVDVVSVREL